MFHERLLLERVGPSRHIVASPDLEVFAMILTCPPPHDSVRVLASSRELPAGFGAGDVYMFDCGGIGGLPRAGDLWEMREIARDLAAGERMLLEEDAEAAIEDPFVWVLAEPHGRPFDWRGCRAACGLDRGRARQGVDGPWGQSCFGGASSGDQGRAVQV